MSFSKGIPLTLLELCQLVRHYLKMVVGISIGCALAVGLLSVLVPPKYEASASITVSDPSDNVPTADMMAVVNDLAQSRIAPYSAHDADVRASAKIGTGTAAQTLTITIEGSDESECVKLVNGIASSIAEDAGKVFEALQEANEAGLADLSALNTSEDVASVLSGSLLQSILGSDRTFAFCSFLVNDAVEAEHVGFGLAALVLVGFVGGLFLAMVVVVLINMVKAPIKDREELEAVANLPVFSSATPSGLGDKLWANIQFATDGEVDSICLVPLEGSSAKVCAGELQMAMIRLGKSAIISDVGSVDSLVMSSNSDTLSIYRCDPLGKSVAAAYCSHDATATVVCARMWDDSLTTLASAIKELTLAKAKIVGIALLTREGA